MRSTTTFNFHSGVTFIELVITVVIVAILALSAHPAYQHALLQVRRAEAKSALYAVLLQQERFYTLHGTYFAFDADTPDSTFKWWSGNAAESSYYEIQAGPCADRSLSECVLISAIPGTGRVRKHEDADCGNFLIDSSNNKSNSVSTASNSLCW